jgi:hypothetical protein
VTLLESFALGFISCAVIVAGIVALIFLPTGEPEGDL